LKKKQKENDGIIDGDAGKTCGVVDILYTVQGFTAIENGKSKKDKDIKIDVGFGGPDDNIVKNKEMDKGNADFTPDTIGTYVITASVKKLSDITRIVSIQASCSGGGSGGGGNASPTAVDDVVTLPNDKKFKIDVLDNDYDSDGTLDNDTVTITSGPSDGTVKVKTDPANKGKIEYDPKNVPAGDYTFTYTVKDNDGAVSNEATVTITVS